MKRDKSILQDDMSVCYFCGRPKEAIHEIYFGGNRQVSIKHGFYVGLCNYHHNFSKNSVHFNRGYDLKLKKDCQLKYEETHSREEFIKLIGRSYLEEL